MCIRDRYSRLETTTGRTAIAMLEFCLWNACRLNGKSFSAQFVWSAANSIGSSVHTALLGTATGWNQVSGTMRRESSMDLWACHLRDTECSGFLQQPLRYES